MVLKNGMNLQIDKAVKSDAQALIAYLNMVGGESDHLTFGANGANMTVAEEEGFIEKLSNSTASALFVGKIEKEIVCVGSVVAPQRERVAHQAELGITVKKKFWGLGIGTHLMQTMIAFAKANGQTEILHLVVREGNLPAISLYKSWGLKRSEPTSGSSKPPAGIGMRC